LIAEHCIVGLLCSGLLAQSTPFRYLWKDVLRQKTTCVSHAAWKCFMRCGRSCRRPGIWRNTSSLWPNTNRIRRPSRQRSWLRGRCITTSAHLPRQTRTWSRGWSPMTARRNLLLPFCTPVAREWCVPPGLP
jgi:hypothetical protein